MKKFIYKVFGEPIAPLNTGLLGTYDGRLYLDKVVFFNRKDVQSVLSEVKKSKIVKKQVKDAKRLIVENAL